MEVLREYLRSWGLTVDMAQDKVLERGAETAGAVTPSGGLTTEMMTMKFADILLVVVTE